MGSETFMLKAIRTTTEKYKEQPQNPDFIFNDKSLDHYKETLLKGIELIQKSMSAASKPFSGILPHELAAKFKAIDLNQSCDQLTDALAEVEELYLNHAIYFHHPHYVAHLNCPVVVPAILAELLLTSINSSVDTWDQSAGGTLIEQKLIDWTTEKIGLGAQADGVFTSGGTQSNLMAMLLARDSFCSKKWKHNNNKKHGLPEDFPTMHTAMVASPKLAVTHLRPEIWSRVNTLHLCKAISEFAHELLIQPELQFTEGDWGYYLLKTDKSAIEYHFRAQVLSLEHWYIDKGSIEKFVDGNQAALDSLSFILEVNESLGIDSAMLPTYMEEISSTLYGSAYKHCKQGVNVKELIQADFQTIETAMMEGHPTFLANNGRIGFDAIDYQAYAPEAAASVKLIWLAAHKSKADFACADDLSYAELLEDELGRSNLEKFAHILQQQGLDANNYWFMPVHPWQWYNKLAVIFAADIAACHLVCMGYSKDVYLAQQSIRTFFNISHPHKRYVKTALSILNMGFMRGLSPYYMSTTPAINDCINGLIEQDPYLAKKGFSILREVASVGYRNHYYETASKDNPYKKMLAALWRESPVPQLKPGQRLMTMAALLHIDAQGAALLPELIKSSGMGITGWLQHYLNCYLSPLLHCLYAYDLSFMPHGENLILVLENNIPVRAIMKDIAEAAAIMNKEVVLSEKVQRLSIFVPEELKTLEIFVDCFDLIFRYMSHILLEHAGYSEYQFWRLVADCILDYQHTHPELADKFECLDLFSPEFTRSCLNRLQLANNQQMIDLADPTVNLKFVGTLKNPIAKFRAKMGTLAIPEECS